MLEKRWHLSENYCPEPDSEMVEKVILESDGLTISQLTEVELVSAISKKVQEESLSPVDGNRILSKFVSHIEKKLFRWIPVQSDHYRLARNWIAQFSTPLRMLDSLHLAIASLANLTLFANDIQLVEPARHFGIDVISPGGDL